MWQTIIGALPAAVAAPISAIVATIDAHLLFAILWALAALAVGAIVRSALAKREARFTPRIRVAARKPTPRRAA